MRRYADGVLRALKAASDDPVQFLPAVCYGAATALLNPFALLKSLGFFPTVLALLAVATAADAAYVLLAAPAYRRRPWEVGGLLVAGPCVGILSGPVAPLVGMSALAIFSLGLPDALEGGFGAGLRGGWRRAVAAPGPVLISLGAFAIATVVATLGWDFAEQLYPGEIPAPLSLASLWCVAAVRAAATHFLLLSRALQPE